MDIRQELRNLGFLVDNLDTSGRLVRCATEDKPRGKNGAYIYFSDNACWFMDWRTDERGIIKEDNYQVTKEEFARIKKAQSLVSKDIKKQHEETADKALDIISTAQVATGNNYTKNKEIQCYNILQKDNILIIPMQDENNKIWSVQYINDDGSKKFLYGGKKKGTYHEIQGDSTIVLCEGYATGASIHEATGYTVIVCFDAGNMVEVSKLFPNAIIGADNDTNGVGEKKAIETGKKYFLPPLVNGQSTDFNDLHRLNGISAVKNVFDKKEEFSIKGIETYPFDDEVYLFILNQENAIKREKVLQEVQERAKTLGKLKEFNKLYNEHRKNIAFKNESDSNTTAFDIDRELFCSHWTADLNGIRTFNASGEVKASNTAIYPLRIMRNMQTKEQKCKIAFYDKTHWKELFVEKEMLLVSSKLTGLTKYGVLVTSDMAKHLANYFADVFQQNNFEEMPSTSKMGWCENNTAFLPLTESKIEIDTHISFSSLIDSLQPSGSEFEYIEFIKDLLKGERKEIKFAIYASLASVLLAPLGALPFIVHIYGQAGIGKTLLTKLCAGIWGKPVENGFLIDPKNTATSFEVLLNLLNNLPFIADDINKLNQNNQFFTMRDFIYLLGGGSGKQRSNTNLTISEVRTWQNVSILNGEKSLTTDDSHGGELLRTIELQLEPKSLFKSGNETAEFLHNNYGFLGKMFVEYIIKYNQLEQAKHQKKDFASAIKNKFGDTKEGKQIESVGVLYATQDLLCGMLGVERSISIDEFAGLIKNIDDVLDTQRAYKSFCDLIMQNSSSFLSRDKILEKGDREPNVRWGWVCGNEYYIIMRQFTNMCKEINIDKRLFVDWCIENGIIENEKNRKDGTKVFFIAEQQSNQRVYKFLIKEDELTT